MAPWHHLQFLQCNTCATKLETTLKRVQSLSMNGNFALDCASPENLVINTSKRCQKSVMDRVATHSSRHKKLASIICAKLSMDDHACGIDTLTNHVRGMVFPLTEHESKELFRQYCRPGGPFLVQTKGESMKLYGRRCWTLLTQMYPVIHLSEGHRSAMLLDPSGLTLEERFMVHASINKERDFDRVAEALNIHVFIFEKARHTPKGKEAKTEQNVETTRTLVGFRRKAKNTGSGKSGASCYADLLHFR